jgi:flagellar assembly factor FliW
VINRDTRMGKQIILSDPRWKTKHDVINEIAVNAANFSDTDSEKKALC